MSTSTRDEELDYLTTQFILNKVKFEFLKGIYRKEDNFSKHPYEDMLFAFADCEYFYNQLKMYPEIDITNYTLPLTVDEEDGLEEAKMYF